MLRRHFMCWGALLATVAALGQLGAALVAPSERLSSADATVADMLTQLFPGSGHAVAVGRQFLRLYPEHADRDRLLSVLGEDFVAAASDRTTLLRYCDLLRREDFSAGRTVVVNNWLLSRTEATLCALRALT